MHFINALLVGDKKKKIKLAPQRINILLLPEQCEKCKELAIIICWTGEAKCRANHIRKYFNIIALQVPLYFSL